MRKFTACLLGLTAMVALDGCATFGSSKPVATATLAAKSGSSVSGKATIFKQRESLSLHIEVDGLSPGSEHGFHIHEKGDCSAADATSAGGHFNPDGVAHGRAGLGPHHSGDLGAIVADSRGRVSADIELEGLSVTAGAKNIVGRSLVIHRDRDDYVSQPAGNAGPRIACGVITSP